MIILRHELAVLKFYLEVYLMTMKSEASKTTDKKEMKDFTIKTWVKVLAWISAVVIVSLNIKLVIEEISGWIAEANGWYIYVIVIPIAILIGLLITLATIFRIANQEKINVKKFLGFNFWRLYKAPMCMLSSVIILEIAVMLMLGSKFGSLLMLVVAILQIIIFSRYMARSELKRLLIAFKGE